MHTVRFAGENSLHPVQIPIEAGCKMGPYLFATDLFWTGRMHPLLGRIQYIDGSAYPPIVYAFHKVQRQHRLVEHLDDQVMRGALVPGHVHT